MTYVDTQRIWGDLMRSTNPECAKNQAILHRVRSARNADRCNSQSDFVCL